jgi:ferritin-like metal-binding protein YciE
MAPKTLNEALVEELKDLYDAEHQIIEALPKMAQATQHTQLRQAFEQHLEQTRGQVQRLEQVFQALGEKPQRKHCKGVAGLISEGNEHIKNGGDPDVLDAALIGSAQKVEHYEIAGYGTARTWARQIGNQQVANLLQQTLDEEGETDHKLTQLAESRVNRDAQRQAA